MCAVHAHLDPHLKVPPTEWRVGGSPNHGLPLPDVVLRAPAHRRTPRSHGITFTTYLRWHKHTRKHTRAHLVRLEMDILVAVLLVDRAELPTEPSQGHSAGPGPSRSHHNILMHMGRIKAQRKSTCRVQSAGARTAHTPHTHTLTHSHTRPGCLSLEWQAPLRRAPALHIRECEV